MFHFHNLFEDKDKKVSFIEEAEVVVVPSTKISRSELVSALKVESKFMIQNLNPNSQIKNGY